MACNSMHTAAKLLVQTHNSTARACSGCCHSVRCLRVQNSAEEIEQNVFDMHPSLASLGDGLPSSAGSQRDEAKRQASDLNRT